MLDSEATEKVEGVPECRVLHGDCLEVLKGYPDEYFSACITDPPYGLGTVKDLPGLLTAWMNDEDDRKHIGKAGFMSREWDAGVPGPRYWREVYRTMRPGAHLLAFAGTRTWDLLSMAIRLAGFENRDTIRHHQGVPSLAWVFGSGFPKSTSISKQLDKMAGAEREVVGRRTDRAATPRQDIRGGNFMNGKNGEHDGSAITAPATDAAKRWEGWHASLKPAWEIILVFRKPLSESSVARQVLQNGCGALNVDASRISTADMLKGPGLNGGMGGRAWRGVEGREDRMEGSYKQSSQGRFPSNFLLSHVPGPNGCQRVGTKRIKTHWGQPTERTTSEAHKSCYGPRKKMDKSIGYADPDGMEEVESWECARDEAGNYVCPIALLDEQSGVTEEKNRVLKRNGQRQMDGWGLKAESEGVVHGDRGGASRFFAQFPGEPVYCQETPESDNSDVLSSQNDDSAVFEPDTRPGFVYQAKAATRERWGILKCKDNNHRLSDAEPFSVLKPLAKNGECALCGSELKIDGHPTQKPQSLMKYLLRLVVPPGGTVLDPFAGSGSTLVAACELGIDAVGVEADEEFVSIMRRRLNHAQAEVSSRLPL